MEAKQTQAAVLLSCLTPSQAHQLLDRMEPQQADALRKRQSLLDDVNPKQRKHVLAEFVRQSRSEPSPRRKTYRVDSAHRRVASFHFLAELPAVEIATLIRDELPQTQVVVISHLPPKLAAARQCVSTENVRIPDHKRTGRSAAHR